MPSNASENPVPNTQGTWPGGGGSNPEDLGQDLEKLNKKKKASRNSSGGSGGGSSGGSSKTGTGG